MRVHRIFSAFISITCALQIISSAGPALAKCLHTAGEKESQDHLDLANQAYDRQAFETALQEYRLAYEMCHSAMAFYGTANSEAQLGRESEAARDFERFLREADDAEKPLRQKATDRLRALSARLTLVEIMGAGDRTTVSVDGQPVIGWVSGVSLYLSPGGHTLRVEGGAAGSFERVLTSTAGGHLLVEVPASSPAPLATAPADREPPAPRRRWWLWIGLATVLIGGGVAAYVVTRSDRPSCPNFCP